MGAVNCCVDCTVDDHPTSVTAQHIAHASVPTTGGSSVLRRSRANVVAGNALSRGNRDYQDGSSHPHRRHPQRRVKRDSYAASRTKLAAVPPLRLRNYLCSCDPCPLSLRIEPLVELIRGEHREGDEDSMQLKALRRVLRGYATYDETRQLDTKLASRVHELLQAPHADEDRVFRHIVVQHHQAGGSAPHASATTSA